MGCGTSYLEKMGVVQQAPTNMTPAPDNQFGATAPPATALMSGSTPLAPRVPTERVLAFGTSTGNAEVRPRFRRVKTRDGRVWIMHPSGQLELDVNHPANHAFLGVNQQSELGRSPLPQAPAPVTTLAHGAALPGGSIARRPRSRPSKMLGLAASKASDPLQGAPGSVQMHPGGPDATVPLKRTVSADGNDPAAEKLHHGDAKSAGQADRHSSRRPRSTSKVTSATCDTADSAARGWEVAGPNGNAVSHRRQKQSQRLRDDIAEAAGCPQDSENLVNMPIQHAEQNRSSRQVQQSSIAMMAGSCERANQRAVHGPKRDVEYLGHPCVVLRGQPPEPLEPPVEHYEDEGMRRPLSPTASGCTEQEQPRGEASTHPHVREPEEGGEPGLSGGAESRVVATHWRRVLPPERMPLVGDGSNRSQSADESKQRTTPRTPLSLNSEASAAEQNSSLRSPFIIGAEAPEVNSVTSNAAMNLTHEVSSDSVAAEIITGATRDIQTAGPAEQAGLEQQAQEQQLQQPLPDPNDNVSSDWETDDDGRTASEDSRSSESLRDIEKQRQIESEVDYIGGRERRSKPPEVQVWLRGSNTDLQPCGDVGSDPEVGKVTSSGIADQVHRLSSAANPSAVARVTRETTRRAADVDANRERTSRRRRSRHREAADADLNGKELAKVRKIWQPRTQGGGAVEVRTAQQPARGERSGKGGDGKEVDAAGGYGTGQFDLLNYRSGAAGGAAPANPVPAAPADSNGYGTGQFDLLGIRVANGTATQPLAPTPLPTGAPEASGYGTGQFDLTNRRKAAAAGEGARGDAKKLRDATAGDGIAIKVKGDIGDTPWDAVIGASKGGAPTSTVDRSERRGTRWRSRADSVRSKGSAGDDKTDKDPSVDGRSTRSGGRSHGTRSATSPSARRAGGSESSARPMKVMSRDNMAVDKRERLRMKDRKDSLLDF